MTAPVWIMGVDPGLASCGWAVLRCARGTATVVATGCVTTTPSDGSDIARAVSIGEWLRKVMMHHAVDEVVTEAWRHYAGSASKESHPTTKAHEIGLVIGAVAMAAREEQAEHVEGLRAQDWRVRLGLSRSASKAEAQARVRVALGLPKVIRPQHASDAAAVALCRARSRAVSR